MSTAVLKIDYIDQKTNHRFVLPISNFKKPTNAREYAKLEKTLDELIDEVRDNSKHPLAIAMQIIGANLEEYDDKHFKEIGLNISEIDFVKYLMKSNDLNQGDLADIFGGQANVSKFLSGERALSKNQIAGLKKKFKISADIFVK